MRKYLQMITSNSRLLGSSINIQTKNKLLHISLTCFQYENQLDSTVFEFFWVENTFATSFFSRNQVTLQVPFFSSPGSTKIKVDNVNNNVFFFLFQFLQKPIGNSRENTAVK